MVSLQRFRQSSHEAITSKRIECELAALQPALKRNVSTPVNRILSPEIARRLAHRRIALRINGVSFVVMLVGFAVLFITKPRDSLLANLVMVAFAVSFIATLYLRCVRCPRCRQPFTKRTLFWYCSPLPEQFTSSCDNCGLSLHARSGAPLLPHRPRPAQRGR